MKLSVWKEVLGPTLVLGGLWLVVSTSTTIFMSWQDDAYQDLLTNNVSVVDAATTMQHATWQMYQATLGPVAADAPVDPVQSAASFRDSLKRLELRLVVQEAPLISQIEQRFRELERSVVDGDGPSRDPGRLAQLAASISADCQQLTQVNGRVIQQRQGAFRNYTHVVLSIRQFLNIAGPLLGVWLGFRAASRLRQQISRITVRLEGYDGDLGLVEVASSDPADLESLDQQVARVEERLSAAVAQLGDARREVLRNERLAAVGQLAAGVAHELRNPLTSVKLLVQTGFPHPSNLHSLTESGVADRERQFQVLLEEIERMERTIQSLLDFARPPPQRRVRHDLRETVRRVLNLVGSRALQQHVTLDYDPPAGPVMIDGDSAQLQQVLVNLLLNGMEAMPGGGCVSIGLLPCSRPSGGEHRGQFTDVIVTDEGAGIPPDVLSHLFEPFVTTKERGTGLGLAVSRRIIEEHGGQLLAANREGRGACFTVRLPCPDQGDSLTATR